MNSTTNLLIQQALLEAEAKKKHVGSVVPQQKYAPKLEEGVYIAVTTDVDYQKNQPTEYGVSDRICITLTVLQDNNNVELISRYWLSKSESSRYVKHLGELLGYDPRLGFELNELLGKTVELEVQHFKNDKGVFASVKTLKSIENPQFDNGLTI